MREKKCLKKIGSLFLAGSGQSLDKLIFNLPSLTKIETGFLSMYMPVSGIHKSERKYKLQIYVTKETSNDKITKLLRDRVTKALGPGTLEIISNRSPEW